MVTPGPRHRVAEGRQFLIQRTVGVSAAIWNPLERREGKGNLPGRVDLVRTNDTTVCGDFVLVEANAREELARCHVRAPVQELIVEAAACFIHKIVIEDTCVGE